MTSIRLSHLALALLGGFVMLSHARATDAAAPETSGPFGTAISFYDTGWNQYNAGNTIVFDHLLGGNPDSYVVDLQSREDFASNPHGAGASRDHYELGTPAGAWWHDLDASSIRVSRGSHDAVLSSLQSGEVRVRVWRLR